MTRSLSLSNRSKSRSKTDKFYISKVLKLVHPDCSISSNTKSQLNYLLNLLAVKLISEAVSLLGNKKTISSREIQTAVRIVFGKTELAKHAVSEGTKAVTKYMSAYIIKSKKTTKTSKAGLIFAIPRVENIIRNNFNGRVSETAPIYLTAILEYISSELLELSGNATRDNKKIIIQPKHLMMAIENDIELKYLAKAVDFVVLGGGVLPHIHPILLKSKKSKTTKRKKTPFSRRRRTIRKRK